MPELVKIPSASAEFVARFDRPYLGLLVSDRPKVFEAVMMALLPFDFRLANTEIVSTGKPVEEKLILRIPDRGISFQFGAEEYRFGKDGSSWATAPEDAEIWRAAETALLTESGAKVRSCSVTSAMHLQLLSKTREEILAPFISSPFKQLLAEKQAESFGCHIRFADGEVLIDHSLAYANGIFLKFSTRFQGKPSIDDILAGVRGDEEQVFKMLDVHEATEASK